MNLHQNTHLGHVHPNIKTKNLVDGNWKSPQDTCLKYNFHAHKRTKTVEFVISGQNYTKNFFIKIVKFY
jgi:hypothetical protein